MTYYDMLEVSPAASREVIKNAYKALAKKYHPDNFATEEEKLKAEEQFKTVSKAYEILGDEEKRKVYDKELSQGKENPEETIIKEKFPENLPLSKLRWVGLILLSFLIGTGAYFGYQYQHKQALMQAEKKVEDEIKKELAVDLGKEAIYLTMTVANNIDFQITPYEEGKKYTDTSEKTIAVVKSKQQIIERGKALQGMRQASASDISRIASSMRDKDLQDVTLKFKDVLLDDYAKNKIAYENKIQSVKVMLNYLTDTSLQNNMFGHIGVNEAVEDLSSKELMSDNPNYGVARQAIIGVLEKEMGKDSANALIVDGKATAKEQVTEDLNKYSPEIYNQFQLFLK